VFLINNILFLKNSSRVDLKKLWKLLNGSVEKLEKFVLMVKLENRKNSMVITWSNWKIGKNVL
jgi:hypothetical protein